MEGPTPKQQKFLDGLAMGLLPAQAAKRAGYSKAADEAARISRLPHIIPLLEEIQQQHRQAIELSRAEVHQILKDAIDIARQQADSMAMIRGVEVVAKMCGYNAPEKKQIDIGPRLARLRTQLETLPEVKLLEMLDEQGGTVIDAECTVDAEDLH